MVGKDDNKKIKWDFFLAHISEDKEVAKSLYDAIIENKSTAFLDKESIDYGNDWSIEIPNAQYRSTITVALISVNINKAYYARTEIQTAIDIVRNYPSRHKLIPVYLNEMPNGEEIVYGLRLIKGVEFAKIGSIKRLADLLCQILKKFKSDENFTLQEEESHILLSYPAGPLVKPELIPRSIIDTYSNLIPDAEAMLVVAEANKFREEANPGTKYIISLNKITNPAKIPAFNFWMEVFDYARKQSPRMLAALLLVVPDDQFDNDTKIAKIKLLNILKKYS